MRRWRSRIVCVALMGVIVWRIGAAETLPPASVSYSMRVPDESGKLRDVAFSGHADAASVTGRMSIGGVAYDVRGIVGQGGSVSGVVYDDDGKPVAACSVGQGLGGGLRGP